MRTRRKWLLPALGALVLIVGVAVSVYLLLLRPEPCTRVSLWRFTENDVLVEIEGLEYASGRMELWGTFTPTREHFHLYGKDLPKDGLQGLGRPTRLEVTASDGIKLVGPLAANQPVRDIYFDILGLSFPVYPEGPVTLSLPFELVSRDRSASMELSITYMACSDKTCLPPVVDKHLSIQIEKGSFQVTAQARSFFTAEDADRKR